MENEKAAGRGTLPPAAPHLSLNRLVLVAAPALPLDEASRGRTGYELLAAPALHRYAQEQAEALRLPASLRQPGAAALPLWLEAALGGKDERARAAAQGIARRLGRNLAQVLLVLHQGDAHSRAARPEWGDVEWARWAAVRWVHVGGGWASGELGRRLVDHAQALLDEWLVPGTLRVQRSPWARALPLVGAARLLPAAARVGLCLDFGHTLVKRGYAHLAGGAVAGLRLFPPLPAPQASLLASDPPRAERAQQLAAFVTDAMAQTQAEARTCGGEVVTEGVFSIASYQQGRRLHGRAGYALLNECGDDVAQALAQRVERQTGHPLRLRLAHDATAAATVYAGERDAAVLVLGSAIGVAFAPPNVGLVPLSPTFCIEEEKP